MLIPESFSGTEPIEETTNGARSFVFGTGDGFGLAAFDSCLNHFQPGEPSVFHDDASCQPAILNAK